MLLASANGPHFLCLCIILVDVNYFCRSANGKRIQDAKMRTIESCLDNCKAAAMIKDKAAASSKITASSKTTASSKIAASVDSCCRELKQRLEGYDKTPAAKRLKVGVLIIMYS